MSKFDEAIDACKAQMQSCNIDCDEVLLKNVAKGLGPSIYNKDANLVAAGDPKELDNIKVKFVNGKLGVEGDQAEEAIKHAIEKIGSSNRQKLRPVFYYLIVKHLGKESIYGKQPEGNGTHRVSCQDGRNPDYKKTSSRRLNTALIPGKTRSRPDQSNVR